NYDQSQSYPVAYAHDGQFYAGGVSSSIDKEIMAGHLIEPHIVVGVVSPADGLARITLLSPTPHSEEPEFEDPNAPMSIKDVGGDGKYLGGLMVDVIKPYIDANYATRCGREDTAIVGYSL